MIYQAIYNLFDNAVKFTNENGYIAVLLTERNTDIEVSIKTAAKAFSKKSFSKVLNDSIK